MELLKTRFLASHHGYFFPEGSNIPISSKGGVDWDTFLTFIINEGTEQIDYYTIYNIVQHVPVEMKSLYATRISAIEKTLNVKPKYPKLLMPQGSGSDQERFQQAMQYYNKCEENISECNKIVLDAIDKVLESEDAKDPGKRLLEILHAEIPMDLTDEEIEAVLIYIGSEQKTFRKNTLLALKVLNRFAKEQEIRFEDAVTVFTEHLG
jgi:hypothetical protein